jgi:hypothetical protein
MDRVGWPEAERSDAPELCSLGLRKLSHQPPNSSNGIITVIPNAIDSMDRDKAFII